MKVIKKYWDYVYIYVLLLVPLLCVCAGILWTVLKLIGSYDEVEWYQIILFDSTHSIYLATALYLIYKNKKNSSFIREHLAWVKGFIVVLLFVQYNFILCLFASNHVWECTFIFISCIAFLFDSKLMLLNIVMYFIALLLAHILRPGEFLPLNSADLGEVIFYRILIYVLTSLCIMVIVYFVERFLMQSWENKAENARLLDKQLKYYKDMELMDMEIRKFRHDIQNHFICMDFMLKSDKMEELKEYFQDLQQSFSFQNKMCYSGNDIVDSILNYELPHNCDEQVKVTIYGNLPDIKTVSAIDMCTLFSNLLSNAIASANQCVGMSESILTIRFASGDRYFSIEIANSVNSLEENVMKKGKKKDRNHGHGVNKIMSVLEKYDGRFEQEIKQNLMTITVYLPI